MKKLNSWFEIDEHQYLMYLLKGYNIDVREDYVAWILDGKWHREDGPAIAWKDGYQAWCINDNFHRTDGPAIINLMPFTRHWYINGKEYETEAEFNEKIKQLV